MSWVTMPLGEIIGNHGGLIQTGPFGSQLHQHEYLDEGVPVVMPKDIRDGRVDEGTVARVSETKAQSLSRHFLKAGSIVFPRRGEISKCAYITEHQAGFLCGTGCIKIEPPEEILDPRFLYYYLGLPHVVQWLERNAIGTTMLNLNTEIIGGVMVPMLPKGEQQRIASTLSVYDDLIENNRRRIRLLEQSARLLYKEWFVHLRFPGHEHVKIKDGVPEGWKSLPLSACVTLQSGGTPSKANPDFWAGDIPWISSGELTGIRISTSKHRVTEEAVAAGSRFAEMGTILGVVRGMSLAKEFRLGIAAKRVCFNQDLKAFVPDRGIESLYLFHALDEQRDRIRQQAGEASHGTKKLETAVLENLKILVPAPLVRKLFVDYVSPIHSQMDVLIQQNRQLERARDLILPRLMSGRLAA